MLFAHIFSFILVFSFAKSAIVSIEDSFSDTSQPLREQRRKGNYGSVVTVITSTTLT